MDVCGLVYYPDGIKIGNGDKCKRRVRG